MVSTTPVEEVSSHTLSHHDCSGQQCTHPGELEAEMREAILRVMRQTSLVAFHAPMEMPEQNNISSNSHLPPELPMVCIMVTIVTLCGYNMILKFTNFQSQMVKYI